MAIRNPQEAMAFRTDDGLTSATTTAPTGATEGVAVPPSKAMRSRVHLECAMSAAGGTRQFRVKVFGYRTRWFTQAATGWNNTGAHTELTTARWFEIFDTESHSDAANFNKSFLLEGAGDFERLETRVWEIGGTTPVLSNAISFAGGREQ